MATSTQCLPRRGGNWDISWASSNSVRLLTNGTFESVGAGAKEIRVRIESNQYRSIYVAKFEDAVYVLHCFVKKEEKTSRHDVEIARARYREVVRMRSKL